MTRSRHAHQVIASSLHILMHKAYIPFIDTVDNPDEDTTSFEEWKERRELESPLFYFWSLTLKFELIILTFIDHSVREISTCTKTYYVDTLIFRLRSP